MDDTLKKSMSIDDLAVMVASGFEHVSKDISGMHASISEIHITISKIETRLSALEHSMAALNSNVNNYLELSEKRYSELKQRDALLAQWLKLIAEKTGVPIDVSQLEKI